jgi:hypothetical protein
MQLQYYDYHQVTLFYSLIIKEHCRIIKNTYQPSLLPVKRILILAIFGTLKRMLAIP